MVILLLNLKSRHCFHQEGSDGARLYILRTADRPLLERKQEVPGTELTYQGNAARGGWVSVTCSTGAPPLRPGTVILVLNMKSRHCFHHDGMFDMSPSTQLITYIGRWGGG